MPIERSLGVFVSEVIRLSTQTNNHDAKGKAGDWNPRSLPEVVESGNETPYPPGGNDGRGKLNEKNATSAIHKSKIMNTILLDENGATLYGFDALKRIVASGKIEESRIISGVSLEAFIAYLMWRFYNYACVASLGIEDAVTSKQLARRRLRPARRIRQFDRDGCRTAGFSRLAYSGTEDLMRGERMPWRDQHTAVAFSLGRAGEENSF
jgi:hypothetical protein